MASTKTIVTMICITLISFMAVGCSDDSSPVAQAPVDTAPPAVPANLTVAYDADAGSATISWAQNTTDADLAGFIVTRDYYGDVDVLVGTPAMISDFEDSAPLMGVSTYNVYSVDDAGNQSAVASCELVRTGDHQTRDLGL
jgi:hypothetical protein